MSRRLLALALLALGACGGAKKAAEESVASAEAAVAAVSAEANRVVPELLAPISATLAEAKSALMAKDYKAAQSLVADVPGRVTALSTQMEQMKKDLSADFATLSVAMPRNLNAVKEKLAKPPRSLSRERLAELQQIHDNAAAEWPAIAQEFNSGEMASAMGKAFAMKARVTEAMLALGLASGEGEWGNLITQPK